MVGVPNAGCRFGRQWNGKPRQFPQTKGIINFITIALGSCLLNFSKSIYNNCPIIGQHCFSLVFEGQKTSSTAAKNEKCSKIKFGLPKNRAQLMHILGTKVAAQNEKGDMRKQLPSWSFPALLTWQPPAGELLSCRPWRSCPLPPQPCVSPVAPTTRCQANSAAGATRLRAGRTDVRVRGACHVEGWLFLDLAGCDEVSRRWAMGLRIGWLQVAIEAEKEGERCVSSPWGRRQGRGWPWYIRACSLPFKDMSKVLGKRWEFFLKPWTADQLFYDNFH